MFLRTVIKRRPLEVRHLLALPLGSNPESWVLSWVLMPFWFGSRLDNNNWIWRSKHSRENDQVIMTINNQSTKRTNTKIKSRLFFWFTTNPKTTAWFNIESEQCLGSNAWISILGMYEIQTLVLDPKFFSHPDLDFETNGIFDLDLDLGSERPLDVILGSLAQIYLGILV